MGAAVSQTYDLLGNRTQVTYPPATGSGQGEVVTSTYDGDNRLRTVTAWDGGVTSYDYDSGGHMVTMTLPNGVQSTALYDRANRLTQITHAAPGDVLLGQYQYQLDGNGLAQVVTETLRSPEAISLTERFLESGGLVVMEAENGEATAGSSHAWQSQTAQAGYGGAGYQRALPDIGTLYSADDLADSPHLAFPIQITTPDDYAVWVRGMAPDGGGDSLHVGLGGAVAESSANLTGFAPNEWSWASMTLSNTQAALDLIASGAYTLDLWLREDGLRVDRVLLITDTTYIPSGVGPAESPRGSIGGGSSLDTHVVTYGYDDLYRLTSANVSGDLTASYGYEYDVLGNRMAYTAALTNTVVTTYTYDAANQLETAMADDTGIVWYYVHDNNGNRLQQLPGGPTPSEGAIQYTYNQRGQLVQVETHDGSSFQLQAEMVYDGNGHRLQAIAYGTGSAAITATYTLDPRGGLPLLVDNGINTTMILYGQVAVGEYASQTAEWAYYLGDAQLSVRQLVDESGTVTQAQTYGPYGVLLHQAGDDGGLFGYKGGQSSTNGLWYFGDGYFDPNTGQFLAINGSPLLPLAAAAMANPGGFLLGPILFISWRRRKGKKGVHPATFLLFGVLLTVGLAGCDEGGGATGIPEAPIISPTGTPIPIPAVTVTQVSTPTSAATVVTITATPTDCPPTSTPTPTPDPQPVLASWNTLVKFTVDVTATPTPTPTGDGAKNINWKEAEKRVVREAASRIANRLATIIKKEHPTWDVDQSPNKAFIMVYGGPVTFKKTGETRWNLGFAENQNSILVHEQEDGATVTSLGGTWAAHELGHAFTKALYPNTTDDRQYGQAIIDLATSTIKYKNEKGEEIQIAGGCTTSNYLTSCYKRTDAGYIVQHNTAALPWEDFADMFSGYFYSFTDDAAGRARYNWMDSQMSGWIDLAIANNRQKDYFE